MTVLPRAATAPELAYLRSDNQSSRLYMTVHTPAVVYSARLAAVPASTDNVTSITYNSGTGTYTDILVDQTLYVGTSAGAYDLGMTRIRSLTGLGATSGTMAIGMTSEIAWAANAYLTVVDEFGLWPRWPVTDTSGTILMDVDVAYANQHRYCLSFPIFPRYAVKWLTGATVNVVRDGSQSWALGNTINSYAWTAPGSSAISGDTTDTVTITYNAKSPTAGYRVGLTVGNTDSVSFTGYGRVFVLADESDAITEFTIDSLTGSYQGGGWSAQVTCYGQADRATIRDRALVILHRRDWYGATASAEVSIGYVADDENIEMIGWIAGESIKWATEDQAGSVTFTIQGPQWWLNQMTMPTVGLKNNTGHPTKWNKFQGLTAKSATWHILMWRTTAPRMMDCFSIENGWAALQLQSGGAQTVWAQLSNILNDFLIAKPCCDSYARLFMQIEQNCLTSADRSSIPSVMTVTKSDWMNEIRFDRRVVNETAGVDLSGDVYDGSVNASLYALSPGRTFAYRGGSIFVREKLAVDNQTTLNALAGAVYGWKNNPYPNWRFQFPSNLHLIDLAPYQYMTVSIAAGDTPRSFTQSNLRVIPREIKRTYKDGYMTVDVTVEAESSIGLSVTGDTPTTPPAPPIISTPPPPPPPPPIPIPPGNAREKWFATTTEVVWAGDYFSGGQPTWTLATNLPGFTEIKWFGITSSGVGYLMVDGGGVAEKFYRSTSPKTGGWVEILARGDTIASGKTAKDFGTFQLTGETLSTIVKAIENDAYYYAVYNGSWVYHQGAGRRMDPGSAYSTSYIDGSVADIESRLKTPAGVTIASWAHDFGTENAGQCWQNQIGGTRYTVASQSNIVKVIKADDGSILYNTTVADGAHTEAIYMTGALRGPQVYFALNTGALYLSDDGSSFSSPATWGPGWILDATNTGGGSLSWTLAAATNSNEFDRISIDRGATWAAMTGNFWSLVTGDKTFVGAGFVY